MPGIGVIIKAVAMGLFQVLGVVAPRVPGQALVTRDTVINVANGAILYALKLAFLTALLKQLEIGLFDVSWIGAGWAQFLVAFLLLDFTRYWVHYADHRVSWLWKFHRVHHSSERLDATSGLRMHLVDFVQLSLIPVVLFGVLLQGDDFQPWVLPAALALGDVFDALEHANLRLDMTRPWARAWNLLFNSPHFHSWHHTRDAHLCDGNYANTLVIWDRLFGTEVTRPEPPALLGLSGDQALDNSLVGLALLRPRSS